jgi:hypothetical protein
MRQAGRYSSRFSSPVAPGSHVHTALRERHFAALAIYDRLYAKHAALEAAFGTRFNWDRLDGNIMSKLGVTISGGWLDEATFEDTGRTRARHDEALPCCRPPGSGTRERRDRTGVTMAPRTDLLDLWRWSPADRCVHPAHDAALRSREHSRSRPTEPW